MPGTLPPNSRDRPLVSCRVGQRGGGAVVPGVWGSRMKRIGAESLQDSGQGEGRERIGRDDVDGVNAY